MPKRKKSTKSRKLNTAWLNKAMKSIGAASSAAFKDIAPNITDIGTTTASTVKDAANVVKSNASMSKISSMFSGNKYVKLAKKTLDQSIKDIKSGDLYNPDRAAEAFMGGFDDTVDDFMDGFEDDGESSVTFNYFDEGNDDSYYEGQTMIADAINKSAEVNVKATKASVDAMIALSSATIAQQQEGIQEINSHLSNMDNTLQSILSYLNENTTSFYEAATAAFDKIGGAVDEDSYSANEDDQISKIFSQGKVNTSAYKKYLKKRLKDVVDQSPAGMILPFLQDDALLETLVSDPVGGLTKGVIGGLIPKVIQGTIEEVDKTLGNMIPNMLSQMNKWASDRNSTQFKRMMGKIFGISSQKNTNIDLTDRITKDAAVFDGVTRNTIVEVLPKYARESTAYLKEIAMHVTKKSEKDLLSGSQVFDTETSEYVKMEDLQKNLAKSLQESIVSAFEDSDFGKLIRAAGSNLVGKDKESYDKLTRQLYTELSKRDSISVQDFNFGGRESTIRDIFTNGITANTKSEKNSRKILQEAIKYLYQNNIGIETASAAQFKAKENWNEIIAELAKNPETKNLIAAGITNETDLEEFVDKYTGNTRALKVRQQEREKEDKEQAQLEKDTAKENRKLNAKGLATGGITAELDYRMRKKKEKEGNRGFISSALFGEDFGQGIKKSGEHLTNSMWALMKGDPTTANREFGAVFTDLIKDSWNATKENFLDPLGKTIFGEKNEEGYTKGGLFQEGQNKLQDTWRAMLQRINGKDYVGSDGKVHSLDEGKESLVSKVSSVFKELKESVQVRLFGEKETDENGNEKKRGIIPSITESIAQGLSGWKEALFGGDVDEEVRLDTEKLKNAILDNAPDALVNTGMGAIFGAMAGSSLLGTLIGGPIGGAVLGFGSTFLMKSDKFKDWLFGPEIEDENGKRRIGGFISEKTQNYFKDHKKTIVGGAALGALKSIVFPNSAGLLTSLVGGPLAGAAVGAGVGLLKESETFHKFLYGDEEKGKKGVIQAFKDIFKGGVPKGEGDEKENKSILKTLGMVGIGAVGAGLTASLIGKVGLFGAMVTPGGPLGAALIGATIAIASQGTKFKKWLFGEKDPDTKKRKGGAIGKLGNYLHVEVMAPMRTKAMDILEDVKTTVKYDILENIRLPFVAAADAAKEQLSAATKKVVDTGKEFFGDLITNLVEPITKTADAVVIKPLKAAVGKMTDITYNVSKFVLTAPFKLLGMGAKFLKGKINKTFTTVNKLLITGIGKLFGFAGGMVKGLFNGVGKVLGLGVATKNYIGEKFADITGRRTTDNNKTGKSRLNRLLANLTSDEWRRDYYNTKADAIEERRKNKTTRKQRADLDYNRAQMSRLLGYDVKYFTEENFELAKQAAKDQGKLVVWKGGKNKTYDEDPTAKLKKLLKRPTAEIAKDGDKSDDIGVRQLSEQHKTNEYLKKIADEFGITVEEARKQYDSLAGEREKDRKIAGLEVDENGELRAKGPSKFEQTVASFEERLQQGGFRGLFQDAGTKVKNFFRFPRKERTKDSDGDYDRSVDELISDFNEKGRARAEGGPVTKNQPVLVGDGGSDPSAAEILVPETNGTVLSQKNGGIKVQLVGIEKPALLQMFKTFFKGKRKGEGESEDLVDVVVEDENGVHVEKMTAKQAALQRRAEDKKKNQEAVRLDREKDKASQESSKKAGSYATLKEKKDQMEKEERQEKTSNAILNALLNIGQKNEEHQNLWSSIFSKKGLVTGGIIAGIGLLFKYLPKLGDFVSSIFDQFATDTAWTQTHNARENGNTAVEQINEIGKDAGKVGNDLMHLNFGKAAYDFVLDDGEWDNNSGAKASYLAKSATKAGKKVYRVGKGIKGLFAKKAATEVAGELGEDGVEFLMRELGEAGGKKVATESAESAAKKGLKTGASKVIGLIDDALKAVVSRVAKAFPGVADNVLAKAIGSIKTSVFKVIEKHFPKIAARITGETTARGAAHAATLGLDTVVFMTLGAINGVSGTARLFQVDESAVDGKMRVISGAFGALTNGTIIGSVFDIVCGLVADVLGFDFLNALAVGLYKVISSDKEDSALDEARATFKNQYDQYQATEIEKQYNTQKAAGLIGDDVTLDQFKQGAKDGTYNVKYKSFVDYNADQHQSIGYKIGSQFSKAGKAIKSKFMDKTTYTDANGQKYVENVDGTLQVYDAEGNDLGSVTKESVDTSTMTQDTQEGWGTKIKRGSKKFAKGAMKVGKTVLDSFNPVKQVKRMKDQAVALAKFGTWLVKSEKTWAYVADDGSYYTGDGKHYNANGEDLGDTIDQETLSAWVLQGLLHKQKVTTKKAGLDQLKDIRREKLLEVGKTVHDSAMKGIDFMKDKAMNSFKDNAKKKAEQLAKLTNTAKNIGVKAVKLFNHKESALYLIDGTGYYILDGDTFTKYNMNGDKVEEGVSTDDVKTMMDGGLLTEGTAVVKGNLVDQIKSIKSTITETSSKILNLGKNMWKTIKENSSEFYSDIQENGFFTAVSNQFTGTKSTVYYTADMTGYYKMNDAGTYDFYNMNGDKIDSKSGIDGTTIDKWKTQSLITEGEMIEDSNAKKAVKQITDTVKDVWNTAKDTVKNKWSQFKNWISGGSGDGFTDYMKQGGGSGGGYGSGKNFRQPFGGRGEEADTQNGFAYYSQEDPKWKNNPYVAQTNDGATMGDTGCGPTAMAMVASQASGGKNVSPTQMANLASASGFRDETGTNANFISYAGDNLGLAHSDVTNPDKNYIQQEVANGNPVILNGVSDDSSAFTKAGHYVVAVGTDANGNILVNDPRGKQYSKAYSADTLAKQTRKAWSFGGNGVISRIRNKFRKKIGGRGPSGDWLSIVRSVKALIAEQKPTYNQSGSMTINYNGTKLTLRPDCSGFVTACLKLYGAAEKNANFTSRTFLNANCGLQNNGFTYSTWSGWDNLQEGDIISRNGHVEIFARNENGTHYVYNGGSTSALRSATPTPTAHKNGYSVVWRPNNAGSGANVTTSGGATTSSSGGASNILSNITSLFSRYQDKAVNGILTGNWDMNFSVDSSGGTTDSTGSTDSVALTNGPVVDQVYNWFRTKGYSPQATSGIMGNFQQESGIDPTKVQHPSRNAAGIAQWENYKKQNGRWKQMSDYAKSKGKEWTDLQSQLEFVDGELGGTLGGTYTASLLKKRGGLSALKASTDVNTAVRDFEETFERAGKPMMDKRYKYANAIYQKYGGKGTGNTQSSNAKVSGSTNTYGTLSTSERMKYKEAMNGTVAADTSSIESLLKTAIKVLESINGNTGKLEDLSYLKKTGTDSNGGNNANIIVTSGGKSSSNSAPQQLTTQSKNADLAARIAKGM